VEGKMDNKKLAFWLIGIVVVLAVVLFVVDYNLEGVLLSPGNDFCMRSPWSCITSGSADSGGTDSADSDDSETASSEGDTSTASATECDNPEDLKVWSGGRARGDIVDCKRRGNWEFFDSFDYTSAKVVMEGYFSDGMLSTATYYGRFPDSIDNRAIQWENPYDVISSRTKYKFDPPVYVGIIGNLPGTNFPRAKKISEDIYKINIVSRGVDTITANKVSVSEKNWVAYSLSSPQYPGLHFVHGSQREYGAIPNFPSSVYVKTWKVFDHGALTKNVVRGVNPVTFGLYYDELKEDYELYNGEYVLSKVEKRKLSDDGDDYLSHEIPYDQGVKHGNENTYAYAGSGAVALTGTVEWDHGEKKSEITSEGGQVTQLYEYDRIGGRDVKHGLFVELIQGNPVEQRIKGCYIDGERFVVLEVKGSFLIVSEDVCGSFSGSSSSYTWNNFIS
jgi:hypothetical protein